MISAHIYLKTICTATVEERCLRAAYVPHTFLLLLPLFLLAHLAHLPSIHGTFPYNKEERDGPSRGACTQAPLILS